MDPEAERAFKQARLLHIAFAVTPLVYILLALQMRWLDIEPPWEDPGAPLWALRLFLITWSVVGLVYAARFRGQPRRTRGQWAGFSPPIQAALAQHILRVAFAEAVAIYGLLLFVLAGRLVDVLGFCAVGIAIFAWLTPTQDRWIDSVRNYGTSLPKG